VSFGSKITFEPTQYLIKNTLKPLAQG